MKFDVFLSHNSKDKPAVRELKRLLSAHELVVWLDEDELQPGMPWQELLEDGIRASRSVAVVVGEDGRGPWEDEEMQAALVLAVRDKRPVIPVLLPGASVQPDWPMFLGNRTWVDLRAGFVAEGIGRLVWGITGVKQTPKNSNEVSRPAAEPDAVSSQPGGSEGADRAYSDRLIKAAAATLEDAKPLTIRALILNVDGLFNRGTFRFEPLRECVTQEWSRRLLAAMETLELLRRYSSFVADQSPDARDYEKLMDLINGYCLAMATDLFEGQVRVSELRDYLGTSEFLARLPKGRQWSSASEIDDDTNTRVDGQRIRCVKQMDKLRKEFLRTAQ